jgi:hypothetical protein
MLTKEVADSHCAKQLAQLVVKRTSTLASKFNHSGEYAFGQEFNVFGKQTEQQTNEKMSNPV